MLEGILGVRRRAAPEDQLGACEPVEGFVQLLLRYFRDPADDFIRERTPERGADLRYLACRSEAIQARQERCMQRCLSVASRPR
jgi:hypothetical protein